MGNEAEKKDELEEVTEEQIDIEGEAPEQDETILATEEIATDDDAEPDEEIEIIREGTLSLKQQSLDGIIQKRVKKLNIKVDKATQQASEAETETALLRERNKILELAIEQQKSAQLNKPTVAPNPDDFDLGFEDPAFQKKQSEHNQAQIEAEVQRQVAGVTTNFVNNNAANEKNAELERKQIKHYERAGKIGAKDYSDTEDVAIEVLGNEITNQIISNFDDSPVMLYYLGKNRAEAERITNLIKTNPIKGVAEIGRLQAELKIKPKRTSDTPEPDEEIVGGKASSSENALKQLAKLRKAAGDGVPGAMDKIRAYKKELKAKGITL